MTKQVSHHNPSVGIPLTLLACVFNASMAMSVKLVNTPGEITVFIRFLISFLLVLLIIPFEVKKRGLKRAFTIKGPSHHIVRWISNILCLYTYFFSIQLISVSLAVVLMMTSSLYIPLVSYIWKKVPIAPVIWWALLTGLAGVVLIVGPTFGSEHWGFVLGLLSGVFAAISYVAARYQGKTCSAFTTNFYLYLVGIPISFTIGGKAFITHFPSFDGRTWLLFGLIGLFGILYQWILILALKAAQVRFVAAFLYSNIVFTFLLNWLFLNQQPSFLSYMGVFLVILSGVLMSFLDPAKQKLNLKK